VNGKQPFRIQELITLGELQVLEGAWLDLWHACPAATLFQSPAWLIPWWRHLGGPGLWTLAFRQQGQLVGLAPLFICQTSTSAPRQLLLLGTGISDYLDILAKPGFETHVTTALFAHLAEAGERWDICVFHDLKPDSILRANTPSGPWRMQEIPQSVCPVLSLPEKVEALPTVVPHRTLEKLRYYRHRLEKTGSVCVERAAPENFEELFKTFLHLHSTRWSRQKSAGVLAGIALQTFHREAGLALLQLGALRLYALRASTQIIATIYCFHWRAQVLYYLSGFDPAFSQFSPGTLLIGHAIEEAIRESATEFDFLRGQEKYKYAWGAKDRPNYSLRPHLAMEPLKT
jgi:CelD/BcsL family acetyltransferase involved in cellulose biosynthesis